MWGDVCASHDSSDAATTHGDVGQESAWGLVGAALNSPAKEVHSLEGGHNLFSPHGPSKPRRGRGRPPKTPAAELV
eukprot:6472308-Amphidinium_carterae.1